MDDVKKQLFINFSKERLESIEPSKKVLCIVNDVYSELIGVPTDVPFNVLDENINQDETEYTIDISVLGNSNKSTKVLGSKVEIYYNAQDVADNVEDFFEPYVDVQDVEDIYSLYDDLDQVEEEDDKESDAMIDNFFQDEEDYDYDDYEDDIDDEKDFENSEELDQFLKNL